MELVLEPDIYSPSVDDTGKYIDDNCKTFPIRCPCGSRKDKVYRTRCGFNIHCKTQHHVKWLELLNNNRSNHLSDSIKSTETIKQQHILIAERDKEIRRQAIVIEHLTDEFIRLKDISLAKPPVDLIDIDFD
jgi:hypothetical protein